MTDQIDREQIADVLDLAADYMEQHGHCKGVIEEPDGAVCAVGAITRAIGCWSVDWPGECSETCKGDHKLRVQAFIGLNDWLNYGQHNNPGFIRSAMSWNDMPKTTGHDVITGLRKAANYTREIVR